MTKNTLSIGGATYDLFVRVPHTTIDMHDGTKSFTLPLGEKVPVESIVETCGGGAANTSVGLARLGATAHFEGVVASDQWGEKLRNVLRQEGVDTSCVTVVEDEVTSFSIVLSGEGGERVILYERGANMHLHDVTFDKDILHKMDWVYLNHLQEESCTIQDDIVSMLVTQQFSHLTWNPGGCQIEKTLEDSDNSALAAETDLMLLNKEEALRFTGKDNIHEALHALINAGVSVACITDGKNGTVATDGKELHSCPILANAQVVDTTGAGDAFGTAMTWSLMNGETLPEALRAGTINAASVVSHIGAQAGLLTDIDLREKRKATSIDVTTTSFT